MAISAELRPELCRYQPVLGSGVFYPKSNEDGTMDEGGYRKEDDQNSITGAGEPIFKINRVQWSLEISCANDMNQRLDLNNARQLAAQPLPADWLISMTNGTVWAGSGSVLGDVQGNTNDATFGLKIGGGGELEKVQ